MITVNDHINRALRRYDGQPVTPELAQQIDADVRRITRGHSQHNVIVAADGTRYEFGAEQAKPWWVRAGEWLRGTST